MNELDISYGVFMHMHRKSTKNIFTTKDKMPEIIIATIYRLWKSEILKVEDGKIIFKSDFEVKNEMDYLDENERIIYDLLKGLSDNNVLELSEIENKIKNSFLYAREKIIDIETAIESDFSSIKRKKRKEYMEIVENIIKESIDFLEKDSSENVNLENIEEYLIINILLGKKLKVYKYLQTSNMQNEFSEFLNIFKDFLNIDNVMNEELEKIQATLKASHVSSTSAFDGARYSK